MTGTDRYAILGPGPLGPLLLVRLEEPATPRTFAVLADACWVCQALNAAADRDVYQVVCLLDDDLTYAVV